MTTYKILILTAAQCTQGAIRLQGGSTNTSGRVEICNNAVWGTVCDDFWSGNDAIVACRQLGLPTTGATILTGSAVPDGTGRIWLDDVQCVGTESRLINCSANALGTNNCGHSEDAGVNCIAGPTTGKQQNIHAWVHVSMILAWNTHTFIRC